MSLKEENGTIQEVLKEQESWITHETRGENEGMESDGEKNDTNT